MFKERRFHSDYILNLNIFTTINNIFSTKVGIHNTLFFHTIHLTLPCFFLYITYSVIINRIWIINILLFFYLFLDIFYFYSFTTNNKIVYIRRRIFISTFTFLYMSRSLIMSKQL